MKGIQLIETFLPKHLEFYHFLLQRVEWDERMKARKTASFGVAYNYSQIEYPFQKIPSYLQEISLQIKERLSFLPNNCLLNFYPDGNSKMGYHSDQVDILYPKTDIVILSVGAERRLRFRRIDDKNISHDIVLPSGSLLAMSQEVQKYWQHSLPKAKTKMGGISLTFRAISP